MSSSDAYSALIAAWGRVQTTYPEWRKGQALFNALIAKHPMLGVSIRADAAVDPYFDDAKIEACLAFVEQELASEVPQVCSACGAEFFGIVEKDGKMLIPTHDHPKPCRAVCFGSGKEGKA